MDLASQHGYLVAEHNDLDGEINVAVAGESDQLEDATERLVEEREDHRRMLPAAACCRQSPGPEPWMEFSAPTPRGSVLTQAGAALLPYARRCTALGDEALEAARAAEASSGLVVAVHSTFAQRTVPFVLGALGGLERRVSIRDVHSEQVAPLLLDGVADIGFALSASVPRGIQRVPLQVDDIVCVVSRSHLLGSAKKVAFGISRDR
jgi:LysR substrate binding domain